MERYFSVPVNFLVLPLFAFVNAQVRIVGVDPATILADPVTLGVFFGAVLGKPLGIVLLVVAAIMALTSVVSFCPLYRIFGLSTAKS